MSGAVVSSAIQRGEGARIGRLADMPITGPGGLNVYPTRQPGLLNTCAQQHLGHGGAANVSRAHKRHPEAGTASRRRSVSGWGVGHHTSILAAWCWKECEEGVTSRLGRVSDFGGDGVCSVRQRAVLRTAISWRRPVGSSITRNGRAPRQPSSTEDIFAGTADMQARGSGEAARKFGLVPLISRDTVDPD